VDQCSARGDVSQSKTVHVQTAPASWRRGAPPVCGAGLVLHVNVIRANEEQLLKNGYPSFEIDFINYFSKNPQKVVLVDREEIRGWQRVAGFSEWPLCTHSRHSNLILKKLFQSNYGLKK
jgi:hypothetical protein